MDEALAEVIQLYVPLFEDFSKSIDFSFYKSNEFRCRISNILMRLGIFWKSHEQNGTSDSTPRKLTSTMHHKKETFYQMHLENGSFQGADQEKNHQK
jgi:hypothetical protein